jgi:hypothetical protein
MNIPTLPFDAALQGSDPIASAEGQVSPSAEEAASRLAGYLAGGSLPMYDHTVRQNVDEGTADEGNNCHNNVLALAGNLWKKHYHRQWVICLSPRDPRRRHHSWIEWKDSAVDVTFNRIVISTATYHRAQAKVTTVERFYGHKGWEDYVSALRRHGLIPPAKP